MVLNRARTREADLVGFKQRLSLIEGNCSRFSRSHSVRNARKKAAQALATFNELEKKVEGYFRRIYTSTVPVDLKELFCTNLQAVDRLTLRRVTFFAGEGLPYDDPRVEGWHSAVQARVDRVVGRVLGVLQGRPSLFMGLPQRVCLITPECKAYMEAWWERHLPHSFPSKEMITYISYRFDTLPSRVRSWFCSKRRQSQAKPLPQLAGPHPHDPTISSSSGDPSPSFTEEYPQLEIVDAAQSLFDISSLPAPFPSVDMMDSEVHGLELHSSPPAPQHENSGPDQNEERIGYAFNYSEHNSAYYAGEDPNGEDHDGADQRDYNGEDDLSESQPNELSIDYYPDFERPPIRSFLRRPVVAQAPSPDPSEELEVSAAFPTSRYGSGNVQFDFDT